MGGSLERRQTGQRAASLLFQAGALWIHFLPPAFLKLLSGHRKTVHETHEADVTGPSGASTGNSTRAWIPHLPTIREFHLPPRPPAQALVGIQKNKKNHALSGMFDLRKNWAAASATGNEAAICSRKSRALGLREGK